MKKKTRQSGSQRLVDAAFHALTSPIGWLSELARHVPPRWKKWLLPALVAVFVVVFREQLINVLKEWYGPQIYLTVLPENKEQLERVSGKRSLLYEFTLDKSHTAASVNDEAGVEALFDQPPASVLRPFSCNRNRPEPGFYRISVVSQNLGSEKAKEYELMISFTGRNVTDSGVRIVYVESDAFKVGYMYQHHPEIKPPSCLRDRESKTATTGKSPPESPLLLTRKTYEKFGLTRDVVMVDGALEAHFFQTIDFVVWIPKTTNRFAILYHIDCQNCRWVFRTKSYAQVLSVLP